MSHRRRLARVSILMLQWLALTATLGALVVHSEKTLTGMVTPQVPGALAFIGAFLLAALLGLTVESTRTLMVLTLLMSAFGSGAFALVLLAPTFDGSVLRTPSLEGFVITRVVLLTMLLLVPAFLGAVIGNVLSDLVPRGPEILAHHPDQDANEHRAWWDQRPADVE